MWAYLLGVFTCSKVFGRKNMSGLRKLEGEVEIRATGADVHHDILKNKLHHLSNVASHFVHDVDLHEGDHGKLGSTHIWNYTLAGKPQKAKTVIKEVDEEKKYAKGQVIEGDLLDDYKTFYAASQVIPKDEETSIVRWTFEYEKKHPGVPEPSALLDAWLDAIKHVDDHHHAQK
ncbi:MLP-like protein 43 isoform X2 [Chenopodium quinoa]|uniref:MLP-like protein 43 isoform X2 n=1 Tax=Chenopodium quinoa TaxID=63459 RepID=UPI000B79301B|nr:MLP-like protein 43 isoform X2 [Chenopodium quinoa]